MNSKRKDERKNKLKEAISEKVIVKAQGKTYADLLKVIKAKVDINEVGVKIKKLKNTNKRDLLLEVGKNDANKLKEAIKNNVQNSEVIIKTNDIVVHISDIDADLNVQEIRQEIKKTRRTCRKRT